MPYGESSYEQALLELFQKMGYQYVHGPDVERDYRAPLYDSVVENTLCRLNPDADPQAVKEALAKLHNFENADLIKKNHLFMEYLQNGIEVA